MEIENIRIKESGLGWYIAADAVLVHEEDFEWPRYGRDPVYLHRDGVWRYSTLNEGVYAGYYASQEEAKKFLATPEPKPPVLRARLLAEPLKRVGYEELTQ